MKCRKLASTTIFIFQVVFLVINLVLFLEAIQPRPANMELEVNVSPTELQSHWELPCLIYRY